MTIEKIGYIITFEELAMPALPQVRYVMTSYSVSSSVLALEQRRHDM